MSVIARTIPNFICSDLEQGVNIFLSDQDGSVYSFGKSKSYSHGHSTVHVPSPTRIKLSQPIQSIACGETHFACLDFEGNVFTFGSNNVGQLGIGISSKGSLPQQKVNLPPIKQISCGFSLTLCLSENGELYSFGLNSYGQLGYASNETSDGNIPICSQPRRIEPLENVKLVQCGTCHVICVTETNEVYAWGNNRDGQLGSCDSETKKVPFKCEYPNNIVDIRAGFSHTLVLTEDKEVFTCGKDNYIGRRDVIFRNIPKKIELSEIVRIECGTYHSLCIDIHGDLYMFGKNDFGQLGIVSDSIHVLDPTKHPSLSNIVDISSRGNHTFVKTLPNEVYAFGDNEYSQLGIKTKSKKQFTPIKVHGFEDIWYSSAKRSNAKSARSVE